MRKHKNSKNPDFVILNDLHPKEQAGAATIALETAQILSRKFQVEYWCSNAHETYMSSANEFRIVERSIRIRRRFKRVINQFYFTSLISEFMNPYRIAVIAIYLLRHRPSYLWIHQIGTQFPRCVVLVAKILGISTIQTFHDFSPVEPNKIYPSDFGLAATQVDSFIKTDLGAIPQILKEKSSRNLPINSMRSKFRRYCINQLMIRTDHLISISTLQRDIFRGFGFPEMSIVNNGIDSCVCKKPLLEGVRNRRILFAGRIVGKGLNRIAAAIAETQSISLVLAGREDLMVEAMKYLPSHRIEYLGNLKRGDLATVMHQVDYVAVLSNCFDVFPTLTLEAIAHGTKVLTTSVTGNSSFSKCTNGITLIPYYGKQELSAILNSLDSNQATNKTNVAVNPFMTPSQSVDRVIKLINC